jgi:preprotein translocase SecE subunit
VLSIYKPGQGYWTRLMSAIGWGTLVAAAAIWLSGQLGAITPPIEMYRLDVRTPDGGPVTGVGPQDEIQLFTNTGEDPTAFGYVESVDGSIISVPELLNTSEDFQLSRDAQRVETPGGREVGRVQQRTTVYAFQIEFVQGGAAVVVLLVGGFFVYWFCYSGKKSGDFLIATEGEMKKVNWSTRREVMGSTWVVIGISLLIAAVLFFADLIFRWFFTLLRVIEAP